MVLWERTGGGDPLSFNFDIHDVALTGPALRKIAVRVLKERKK